MLLTPILPPNDEKERPLTTSTSLPVHSYMHMRKKGIAGGRAVSGGTDILGGRGMDKNIDVQFATALQKKKIFKKSVPYWKLCFSKQILKSPGSPSLEVILYE